MVVQKFFLEDFFELKNFFVKILTFSTAGWSKALTLNILLSTIVSKIKEKNSFPIVLSSNFLTIISLNGIFFSFNTVIKEFFWDSLMFSYFFLFRNFAFFPKILELTFNFFLSSELKT